MPIEPYDPIHSPGIAALCRVLGWPTYSDTEVVSRGCTAPGVVVRVALDDDGRVVGFAQALGDGVAQSFLASWVSHRTTGAGAWPGPWCRRCSRRPAPSAWTC